MDIDVERFVQSLHDCGPGTREEKGVVFAAEITSDIKEYCSQQTIESSSNINSVLSVLLNQERDLNSFLAKCGKSVVYRESIENILTIFKNLLTTVKKDMANYLAKIMKSAKGFINAKEASTRILAFSVIGLVVDAAALVTEETIAEQQLDFPLLFKQLMKILSQTPDKAGSARREFLKIFGRLALHFPNVVTETAGRLITHFLFEVNQKVGVCHDKDNVELGGLLEGLSNMITSFHLTVSQSELEKFHSHLLNIATRGIKFKKRSSPRVALECFVEHSGLFGPWLLRDYFKWFAVLKEFAELKMAEDHKIGLKALNKLMEQSARHLHQESDSNKRKEIISFTVQEAKEILDRQDSSRKLKTVAIQALGAFGLCLEEKTEVDFLCQYLMKKASLIFVQATGETSRNEVALLPAWLESVGQMLSHRAASQVGSDLRIEEKLQLQKMFVSLFTRYLDFSLKARVSCGRAAALFLIGIRCSIRNQLDFVEFIEVIVRQCLISSIRTELVVESLTDYAKLWTLLLNMSQLELHQTSLEHQVVVSQVLDQQIVKAATYVLERLDLSSKVVSEETLEETSSNAADYLQLYNMTLLLELVLLSVEPSDRLQNYLQPLGAEAVARLSQYPLVASLYRIVALVLSIAGEVLPQSEHLNYQQFMSSAIERLTQLSDDQLRQAVVKVVLSSPAWLVQSLASVVTSAITSALKMGLTNPIVARWPLDALEHWLNTLPADTTASILQEALPVLEPYLSSVDPSATTAGTSLFLSGKRPGQKTNYTPQERTEWNSIQRRVVSLLGRAGPGCIVPLLLSQEESQVAREAAGRQQSSGQQLNFAVPMADMKPVIHLEAFLPRILNLVQHSSDLNLRLSACEFLQAVALFLTGTCSRRTAELQSKQPLTPIYASILPTILRLSVDSNDGIRKLFYDLTIQLVHWFSRPAFQRKEASGKRTVLGPETALLLQLLTDSAGSDSEAELRELAAFCLTEFLKWSIKQSRESDLIDDPAAPGYLFQKLRAMALHPSSCQRLGAALVIKQLLPDLLKSDALTSIFTLDLTAHFIVSLGLAERDPPSLGTKQLCIRVLDRLVKILHSKKDVFSMPDERRRAAPLLTGTSLDSLQDFLLQNAFAGLPSRRTCLKLYDLLFLPSRSIAVESLPTLTEDFATRLDVFCWLLRHRVSFPFPDSFIQQHEEFTQQVESLFIEQHQLPGKVGKTFKSLLEFWKHHLSSSGQNNLFIRNEVLYHAAFIKLPLWELKPLHQQLEAVLALLPVPRRADLAYNFRVNQLANIDTVRGLIVLAKSRCLPDYSISPVAILQAAVESAEPLLAVEMIHFALLLGLDLARLAAELKNPPNGQLLCSKLGRPLLSLIGRHLNDIRPFLPEMGNGDEHQWTLLIDLIESQLPDKKEWIVNTLLSSWEGLERHADTYDQLGHLRLLLVSLVRAALALVKINPLVRKWIIETSFKDIHSVRESVLLFKVFTDQNHHDQLILALQQFFSDHFASRTIMMQPVDKSDYLSIFNPLIGIASSVPPVFSFVSGIFALEPHHPSIGLFVQSLKPAVGNPNDIAFAVRALSAVYEYTTKMTIDAPTRLDGVEKLYASLIEAVSRTALEQHLESLLLSELVRAIGDSSTTTNSLVKKAVLCSVLSACINHLGLESLTGCVNVSFCRLQDAEPKGDGKDFLRYASKLSMDKVWKMTTANDDQTEVYERMQSGAFNLIVAIGNVTESKIVDRLIFKQLSPKLWNALVGTLHQYALPIQPLSRHHRTAQYKQFLASSTTQPEYIESQPLCVSSLAEDVYRFDFNQASLAIGTYDPYASRVVVAPNDGTPIEPVVRLPLDQLDEHRCMASLENLLRQQPVKSPDDGPPDWMTSLRRILSSADTHRNVVLFIVRLIMKLSDVFRPHAQFWYYSLLVAMMRKMGDPNGKTTNPLNTLFRQCLDTILEWCKENSGPPLGNDSETIKSASGVIREIVHYVDKDLEVADVFKDNISMLKAALFVWEKLPLEIPYDKVEELLASKQTGTTQHGLQVLDPIIQHGFFMQSPEAAGRIQQRLVALVGQPEGRQVARSSATLCATILARQENNNMVEFEQQVTAVIKKLFGANRTDVFIDVVYEVSKRHVPLLKEFVWPCLSILNSLYGSLKNRCLEVIAAGWMYLEDPWNQVTRNTMEGILKGSNAAEICPVLSLLKELIGRVDFEQWRPLWKTLVRLARHQNPSVRSSLYEVFRTAYDLPNGDKRMVSGALLRACSDSDVNLKNEMQNFVAEKLPETTTERLLAYLEEFFQPEAAADEDGHQFIAYCSSYLLERATKSHLFSQPIFDQPLDDVPFVEFDIASLAQFSLYQQGSSRTGIIHPTFGRGSFRPGMIRQTVGASTQLPETATWLTMETAAFSVPGGGSQTHYATPTKVSSSQQMSSSFTWDRFMDPSTSPKAKRNRATTAQSVQAQPLKVYRKYRTGELPDIQFQTSGLVIPLQAVAFMDAQTAKSLFCSLLAAVRRQVKEIQGNDSAFVSKLNGLLAAILKTPNPGTLVARAVMEYLWTSNAATDQLDIDSSALVQLARNNHLHQLAILTLESCLPISDNSRSAPSAKRAKKNTSNQSGWFSVADLYADLDDVDSLRAVLTEQAGCCDTTRKALNAESNSDWKKAAHFYKKAAEANVSSEEERIRCNEFQLRCLEQLGHWDAIGKLCTEDTPSWHLRACVRSSFEFNQPMDYLTKMVHGSCTEIETALLPELAAFASLTGSNDRAGLFIDRAIDDFISRYGQVSALNFGGKRRLLELLCTSGLVKLCLAEQQSSGSEICFGRPQSSDSLTVWESILTIKSLFQLPVTELKLQMASAALKQHDNFEMAQTLLNGLKDVPSSMEPLKQFIESQISFAKASSSTSTSPSSRFTKVLQAKEVLTLLQVDQVNGKLAQELHSLDAKLCTKLFDLLNSSQAVKLDAEQIETLSRLWNLSRGDKPRFFIHQGLEHLKRSTSESETGSTYYALAKYCYEYRNILQDYEVELTRSVLRSMKHDSIDGQALFPLVIMAVKECPEAVKEFQRERSGVPLIKFLPWINQLVSHTNDDSSASIFGHLLADIAEHFPNHIRLPFAVSQPRFLSQDIELKLKQNDLIWQTFYSCLDYLRPPEKAVEDFLIPGMPLTCEDWRIFKSKYLNLKQPTKDSPHGLVHYAFSSQFSDRLTDEPEANPDELRNLMMQFKKKTSSGPKSLADYSPWLANYRRGDDGSEQLQFPTRNGQELLTVEAFRDEISFFKSKQLPLRITLIGNGAVEHPMLIKHGEDVRQDERIVQLLSNIDLALQRDTDCRKRRLRIRTFQVIPLSPTCGMFEWVPDTVTLKGFIETDLEFRAHQERFDAERKRQSDNFPSRSFLDYFTKTDQSELESNYRKLASLASPGCLAGALKRMSLSAEVYFYFRQRLASSHGAQSIANWILGIGDRHLSNSLVSTKTGDLIGIDYGIAFGLATSNQIIPELVPVRLTPMFQQLIHGLGLYGPIRESMIHTLRVTSREESGPILAALSVFATEPTLDWLRHMEKTAGTGWTPRDAISRAEKVLQKGAHPADITCRDLSQNITLAKYPTVLEQLMAVVRGSNAGEGSTALGGAKRKQESISPSRGTLPLEDLTVDQQVDCLIEQSTDVACLSRMYWGWEPWT